MNYLIWFEYPKTKEMIYLASDADILKIAYMKEPILPCTHDTKEAKIYNSIEDAKTDIYRLRYYHRKFLYVKTGIKSIIMTTPRGVLENTTNYSLLELVETYEN